MLLSIIIVNYNVKYFLEQCLCSVRKALEQTGAAGGAPLAQQSEVWVVDNQSTDGSLTYLQPRFPFVQFIANRENSGFARANNQALLQARGRYILFLNPDTILPEDALQQCLAFMEQHPEAGALGVQMIDGSGCYLPESKRGFPTPWVSFCKMSGLTRLFPGSRLLAGYYLGHLPSTVTHEVEVLSGAFMWVRKAVLNKTGGFDERFFMYAEDIDLSYRIRQAGYKNYYLPTPTILHFKGESTRKDASYIKQFYTAMIQFVQKHNRGVGAWLYTQLLKAMIGIKSLVAPTKHPSVSGPAKPGYKNIAVLGDACSRQQLQELLANRSIPFNLDQAPVDATVFCEGPDFSFTSVIRALQTADPRMPRFIHGYQTGNAVGSSDKATQGAHIV